MYENLIPKDGELYFFEDFLSPDTASQYQQIFLDEIPWQQRSITLFGKTVDQPRLISWHADRGIEYCYSGIHLKPEAWNPKLLNIKKAVETTTGFSFNAAFLNLYRDGRDYMGWHRDNEKSLGPKPIIASLSLGAERKFKLKHVHKPELKHDMLLRSGSLLIMGGKIQHHWKHCLPKSLRVNEPRINITFRKITC